MNNTNPSNRFVAILASKIATLTINGPRFIGLTYTAKKTGEMSRFTLQLGASYENCVRESLRIAREQLLALESDVDIIACNELINSYENTLAQMALGLQNEAYTKAELYETIIPGLKIHLQDNSLEVCGLVVQRKVLIPGVHKPVKSSANTLAKNHLKKAHPLDKYRTLALDIGVMDTIRIAGSELEVA